MATLRQAQRDPSLLASPLDVVRMVRAKEDSKGVDSLLDELVLWKKWERTPAEIAAVELIEPKIKQLHRTISKSVFQWKAEQPSLTLEEIRDLVSEARGELSVWNLILYQPRELEKLVKELKELEDKQKAKEEAGREVPKKVQKYA